MSVFRILQVINVEVDVDVACENIRFSSLFAAGDVETSPVAKSGKKRLFSQANVDVR